MKRYGIFYADTYYPSGGFRDFVKSTDASLDEILAELFPNGAPKEYGHWDKRPYIVGYYETEDGLYHIVDFTLIDETPYEQDD